MFPLLLRCKLTLFDQFLIHEMIEDINHLDENKQPDNFF